MEHRIDFDFYSDPPPELEDRFRAWMREDRCFATLVFFLGSTKDTDPKARQAIQHLVAAHEGACGRCWINVRVQADRATDALKKRVYRDVLRGFLIKYFRLSGLVSSVESRPEGRYYRATVPPELDVPNPPPFTTIEMFYPDDSTKEGHVIFDVKSESMFENPRAFVQHLDLVAARELKAFPSETGQLHWRTIVSDERQKLMIRWQGQTKELAPDWALHDRYSRLVSRYAKEDRLREEGARKATDPSGLNVLPLRDLALKYDERTPFAGYLKTTLGFRKIDADRQGKIDALNNRDTSASEEVGRPRDDRDRNSPAARLSKAIEKRSREEQDDQQERLGLKLSLERLQKLLTPRQRQILTLCADELTDEEIGVRLSLRRETINREKRKIKKLAARLKP